MNSNEIKNMALKIQSKGGRLYLVGGAVRDLLNSQIPHDKDYCVVGISSEEFEELFPKAVKRGISFWVYDIDGVEFALARKERKIGNKHTDFEIQTDKKITIEEDLKRRDITINSMAIDVLTDEIIDPFNGQEDLKNKVIRATSEAFYEDALRVYRVARFVSKLNFNIDEKTMEMMRKAKDSLVELSVERVFEEFRKALNTDNPQNFFYVLKETDTLDVHFAEIKALIGALQPPQYHPEGDAFEHSMLALKMAASITSDEKIRFSALVHDLGKGTTPPEEYPHHVAHDDRGVPIVEEFCNKLKIPTLWKEYGMVTAKEHMKGGLFNQMTPKKQIAFLERVEKTKIGFKGLEIVVECDRNCRGDKKDVVEFAEIGQEVFNKINGKYIKEKYGELAIEDFKTKLHEDRIKYLKQIIKKEKENGSYNR